MCRIEPVRIIYNDQKTIITPDLKSVPMTTTTTYINSCTGLSLTSQELSSLLTRMSLSSKVMVDDDATLSVSVPPTRPDILHECDIMEDAAIAYGFNKLQPTFPTTHTVASPLAISKLADLVRAEWAQTGWVEVLSLILVST